MTLATSLLGAEKESAGQTLLLAPTARATSMGESLTAHPGSLDAAHYNPAHITSLQNPEASVLYQQQFEQESFGVMMMGLSKKNIGFGLEVGYFDIGTIELYNVDTLTEVKGQQDYFLKTMAGKKWNAWSFGLSGTYFSSTLIETKKASAFAVDTGVHYVVSENCSVGGSLQNWGSKLSYGNKNESLPQLVRAGASYEISAPISTTLNAGYTYFDVEQITELSGGIEIQKSPLSLRGGLRKKDTLQTISLGMGIQISNWTFDYNLDLRTDFDSQHKFSLKYSFIPEEIIKAPEPQPAQTNSKETIRFQIGEKKRIYTSRQGDTWESLAIKFFGDRKKSQQLKNMNLHLGNLDGELKPGQKIIVP